jgi:histidinol-phosphate aminotransferase
MIPLDKNESYWLLDDELAEAFNAQGSKELSRYPNYAELKLELAAYAEVTPEQICITPGSDVAIQTLAEVSVGRGEEAVLPVPTFYGYESILDRVGVAVTPVCYTESNSSFVFPIEETLEILKKDSTKALFLCQPNNPLGCSIPDTAMRQLIEAVRGTETLIVSDEAYFEFSGKTLLPLLDEMPNLIIIRTLSKGFGLSGARVGYCIAAPEIIQKMEAQMLPWPIAHTSVFAARAALRLKTQVQARLKLVIEEREKFSEALSKLPGVTVYPSETNFLLVRVPNADVTAAALLEKGIKVALAERMSRYPKARKLLHSTLRIAIPAPEDIPIILDVLRVSCIS